MATPINEWSEEERPREKISLKGVASLTDSELISVIIRTGGSGSEKISAVELGRQILNSVDNKLSLLSKRSVTQLSTIKGVGKAKASAIVAAFELGRRSAAEPESSSDRISSADDIFHIMGPYMAQLDHEECWIIYLNMNNRIIGKEMVSCGGINSTIMDIKLISKKALEKLASKLIMVHNHPSGNIHPSDADKKQTVALREAVKLLDISLMDHIIIAGKRYYSFFDNNC